VIGQQQHELVATGAERLPFSLYTGHRRFGNAQQSLVPDCVSALLVVYVLEVVDVELDQAKRLVGLFQQGAKRLLQPASILKRHKRITERFIDRHGNGMKNGLFTSHGIPIGSRASSARRNSSRLSIINS
jgi:hypothetical protein